MFKQNYSAGLGLLSTVGLGKLGSLKIDKSSMSVHKEGWDRSKEQVALFATNAASSFACFSRVAGISTASEAVIESKVLS